MFHTSGKPKKAKRFWPGLFAAALNKVRLTRRKEQYPKTAFVSAQAEEDAGDSGQYVLADAVGREVKDVIFAAMRRLKPRHRAVLILRCFRQMEYAQIAESLQCSEFAAKVHFYRAKRHFQKQLWRSGFGRGSFLAALVLFGKWTAPAEAAKTVAVSAGAAKVGFAAGLAAVATSKSAILSVAAAGAITLSAVAVKTASDQANQPITGQQAASSQIAGDLAETPGITQEYWYYYPRGAGGPVMMRLLRWDGRENTPYCQWLQNETANYYFDRDKNTIYIRNHHIWHDDLGVWRLPTDSADLRQALAAVQPTTKPMRYVKGGGAGLLVTLKQDRQSDITNITHHINILDEQYFLFDWPSKASVVDLRDTMHKRGWTYFRVTGHIGADEVHGTGRLPFVYATSRWSYPWLKMTVGNRLKLVDTGSYARLYDGSGNLLASYEGGTFFEGLGRPWMGLHTIDTVRRDAARKRMRFRTEYDAGRGMAKVTVYSGATELIYEIAMEKDLIESITIARNNNIEGTLELTYLQEIDETARGFVSPRKESPPKWRRDRLGILWLTKLCDDRW